MKEAVMKQMETIYDISVTLGAGAVDWPGLPPYCRELIADMKTGAAIDVSKLTLVCHVGTHVDTPAHFIRNGKNMDQYPIERWILPAQVVRIKDKEAVRSAELKHLDIRPGEALLVKTENSMIGRVASGVFSEKYVYISPEAADFLVSKKVGLLGIDYAGVDSFPLGDAPIHSKLLGADMLLLEGINLKDVPEGRYTLFCLPLKVSGAEGSPARAVLVR
jgi:arylformamidase